MRRRPVRGCAAQSSKHDSDDARVARFVRPDTAGLLPCEADVSDDVVFVSDLAQFQGKERLRNAFRAWNTAWTGDVDFHESRWSVTRVSSLAQNTVAVSWRVRWVPLSVLPFVRLAKLFGLRVAYFDLLDRYTQVSVFSWGKLFAALARAVQTGELRLPEAAVTGRTLLTCDGDGRVSRIEERLDLMPEFQAQRVRNRRVARDTADWLSEWRGMPDADVSAALSLNAVPGMGQFDIDGLDPETQSQRIDDVGAVLGLATVVVLAVGLTFAKLRADEVARVRQEREWLQPGDDADVGARMRSRRQTLLRNMNGE
jgi:hypothetical protein